jgi:hypothetical protein
LAALSAVEVAAGQDAQSVLAEESLLTAVSLLTPGSPREESPLEADDDFLLSFL